MRNIHTFPVSNPFPVTPTPAPAPVIVQPPAKPVFAFSTSMLDTTVFVSWMDNGTLKTQPIPSDYCATQDGAIQFQAWLLAFAGKKVNIFQAYPGYPQGVGNLDPQSKMVPWFLDPTNGVENNAGLQIVQFRETPLPNGGFTGLTYGAAVAAVLASWGISQ